MQKDAALAFFHAHLALLKERYGVTGLWLAGSTARNEAGPDSDLDLVASFQDANLHHYVGLHRYLETTLEMPVDLITREALASSPFRLKIIKDAIRIA